MKLELDTNAIERGKRLGKFWNDKRSLIPVEPTHFKTKGNILAPRCQLRGTAYAVRKHFSPTARQVGSK